MTDEVKLKLHAWTARLLTEVQEFDASMFPPTREPKKEEKILGDCPDAAKPFFALAQFYCRECARIKLEEQFQEKLSEEDRARHREMDQKHDALMEMFWGICLEAIHWPHGEIGVRKGWKLVERTSSKDPASVLMKLLGGQ